MPAVSCCSTTGETLAVVVEVAGGGVAKLARLGGTVNVKAVARGGVAIDSAGALVMGEDGAVVMPSCEP